MASFDEFLRTGKIGPIATGMTRDAVRDRLGDPTDTSVGKSPEIWKYGPFELSFYRIPDGSEPFLTSIVRNFDPIASAPPAVLDLEGWLPSRDTNFEEFREHLRQAKIPIYGGVESGPRQHLVLGSSVRVTFDQGELWSVGYTSRREPEYKQLSLSVRKDDLHFIHQEAKARGVSVAALCSLWIGEHAMQLKGQKV